MAKLIGTGTNQVPSNADLGTIAYQDSDNYHRKMVQDTAPSSPATGDMWFDDVNNAMKVWTGTRWDQLSNKFTALGSMLYSWDNSVASASGTGWRTVSNTLTLPNNSELENYWADMMSVTFHGYISSGTYYWTWRVYDVTANTVVQPISGPSSYLWYGNPADDGGFRFRGGVHYASQQPARVLDVTGRGGNGIILEMRPSNSSGSTPHTNSSQTLYADQIFWYAGAMTGMHNETGY